MFLKCLKSKGVERLYFYESYYENGRVKQRCLKSLGRLDELRKKYDDPVSHFRQEAAADTRQQAEARMKTVSIDLSAPMADGEDAIRNVGYGILKEIYKELRLDVFWKQQAGKRHIQYDLELIFRLLVISRVLYPGSKKAAFEGRGIYFENIDGFSLDDVYNSLGLINESKTELQKWIYAHSGKIFQRDLSVAYFDCTNYYFDIGSSDTDALDGDGNPVGPDGKPCGARYRKRGPEKNHRPDPIVEMGLLTDRNGIPLAYELFPGNESEKLHMRPIVNRMKAEYSTARVIFVADRGLNTSDNIYYLNGDNRGDANSRDGYVYGQSVRGADAEFRQWVLSGGYSDSRLEGSGGETVVFRHKSRIFPRELHVNVTVPGQKKPDKKPVLVDQKQMVYYSAKYAAKQKKDRETMVARAKDLILHPKKYDRITAAGSAAYVKNIAFSRDTGEVVAGRSLDLDTEKISEEEKYDGYYSIVTSELGMSDGELRNVYRGLAEIEDTFKISKSDLLSRPVFVSTNEHIDGHFATCFTALVLIRLLQAKVERKFPVAGMLDSLRKYNCIKIDTNIWQFIYYDEIIKEFEKVFDLELNNKYRNQLQIRRLLRY